MTTFPPSLLEEIRNRLPLSGVIGSRIRLTRAGREFKGCCPFHNEKTPSFYVNDDKQFFHCFGCGAHGDVIGFTIRHDRMSFPEAVEALAGQAGLQLPRDTPVEREKYDSEKRLYNAIEAATAWFEERLFSPEGREALAYLRGRGLSDEAIRRFRLGYSPADAQALLRKMTSEGYSISDLVAVGLAKKSEDRNDHYSFFRNRVMFPVGDRRGRTVAFGARIMGDGEPKYLNSPDHALFHKGHLLYGLSRARAAISQGQSIIVVEGYMDVIALVEAGYSGAVAPLGTALTEDQMQALWKLLPPIDARDATRDYSPILCFDGDNAGLRAASRAIERALPLLTPAQTLRIATMAGAKDPDELIRKSGKGAFDGLMKQALPMIDALWNMTLAGRQLRTPEERGAFTSALRTRTAQIKDEALRKLYGAEFKKRLDDAFGWKPQNTMQRQGGKWNKGGAPQAPYTEARRAPQKGQRMREKILLALMLNHPALFDEFGEGFACMEFAVAEFADLRQHVVDYLSQEHDATPTADELHRALQENDDFRDSRRTVKEILSAETFVHAKAARSDASVENARGMWLAVCREIEKESLENECKVARSAYHADPTDENKARMMALQERLEKIDEAV